MDPNAVLQNFLDACAWGAADEEARENAIECLRDLLQWIERGGFLPSDPRKREG